MHFSIGTAEDAISDSLRVVGRHDDRNIAQKLMEFGAFISGDENRSSSRQHGAEFRGQRKIGGMSTLRQNVQIGQIEKLAELVFRLQRQKMHVWKTAITLDESGLERSVASNNEMDVV